MEPSPEERVLVNIPEILDAIFKFLDPQNLVKCRKVCRRWRAISNMHLKRRLTSEDYEKVYAWFGTMRGFRGGHVTHKVTLIGYSSSSYKILSPTTADHETNAELAARSKMPKCLVLQDASSAVVVNGRGYFELRWRKVKPMPWFVSKVLEVDWLSSVEKLVLDRCLTVDDWNAAANAILAKFPSLAELQLWLPQERSNVLPLVYSELLEKESQQVALPSIKKVVLQYYIWFNSTPKSCFKPYLAGFKLEGVEWFSGVEWDFLKQCPNLQDFHAGVFFGHPELISGQCDLAEVKASRAVLENTEDEYGPWEFAVWNDFASNCQKVKIDSVENGYNSTLAQDIANLISTFNPARLRIPLQLKLHSALASSEHITNTTQLEFSESPSPLRLLDQVEASRHDVASAFKLAASFDNIQKLNFPYFCSRYPLDFQDANPVTPNRFARNLVTLMIRSCNDWMQDNLNRLMPNVQLLIVSYTPCAMIFYELPKLLKLCSSLSQLKHLVFVITRQYSSKIDTKAVCAELADQDFQCFGGLTSLTVVSGLALDLKMLTEQFLDICSSVKSIRKLGVFSYFPVYENQADELDVSELGLPIPDHLAVRVGSTALLGTGEAEFDGMEHSHVTWRELLESF